MGIASDARWRGAIWIRILPVSPLGEDFRDGPLSQLGPVALGAQVAEHQGSKARSGSRENLAQQTPALFVAQMKMRTGIRVDPQQFRVMVGFHVNEIGIGKPAGKTSPIPKVGGDHNFSSACLSGWQIWQNQRLGEFRREATERGGSRNRRGGRDGRQKGGF